MLGETPVKALFPNVDPVGKTIRIAGDQYEVVGYVGPRPNAGGLGSGQDDFIVIPYTTYQKQFGWRRMTGNIHAGGTQTSASAFKSAMIAVVPAEGATRDQAHAGGRADHAHPARPASSTRRTTSTSSPRTPP